MYQFTIYWYKKWESQMQSYHNWIMGTMDCHENGNKPISLLKVIE